MNYEEVSEHILVELEYSLGELENLENREQLERGGIDVQNDIERYSALIDSFKFMAEKAEAFDAYHGTIQSHLHVKGEPEFSSSSTEVLSDLIDIHDDYEEVSQ